MAFDWALRWMLFGSAAVCFCASQSASQTICDRMLAVTNRSLTIRNALGGLHLVVASGLRNDSIYNARYLRRASRGDGYEGFEVETLDALAKLGNFTYELKLYDRDPRESWDTMLRRMARETDFVAYSWWTITTERELAGLVSPYPFQDQSPILVQLQPVASDTPFSKVFLQFAEPVSPKVWGIIIAATLCTALLYWAIEHQENPEDSGGIMPTGILHTTYLMIIMWTGAGAPNPARPAGKLILAAWSFTGLLVIAAYTANLATFLIKKPSPPSLFKDVENLKSRGGRVCLDNTSAVGKWFINQYPEVPIVSTDVFPFMFEALSAKGCEATVSAVMQSRIRMNDPEDDDRCNLVNVGLPMASRGAGWVVSLDYGPASCKAVVRDTLRHLFLDLEGSGQLKSFVDDHLVISKPCKNPADEANEDSSADISLDVLSMAGIFVIHAVALASAALLDVITRLWARKKRALIDKGMDATLTSGTVNSETSERGPNARRSSWKHGGRKSFSDTSVGEKVDSLEHHLATLTKLCVEHFAAAEASSARCELPPAPTGIPVVTTKCKSSTTENRDKVDSLEHQLATLTKLCVERFAAVESSITRLELPSAPPRIPAGAIKRKSSKKIRSGSLFQDVAADDSIHGDPVPDLRAADSSPDD